MYTVELHKAKVLDTRYFIKRYQKFDFLGREILYNIDFNEVDMRIYLTEKVILT